MKFQIFLALTMAILATCEEEWAYSKLGHALNPEQARQAQILIENSKDIPKSEFKKVMRDFVASLPENLQEIAKEDKKHKEDRMAQTQRRFKTLSIDAQKAYYSLDQVRLNEKISIRETTKKRIEILESIQARVLKELKRAALYGVNDERDYVFDF